MSFFSRLHLAIFLFATLFVAPYSLFAATPLGGYTPIPDRYTGVYNGTSLTVDMIRNGNVTLSDIPLIIVSIIQSLMVLVGTICVVAIIYHAVRMQLASGILGDSSGVDKAKKGIYGAMMGFVLSMTAWFIMTKLVAIFGGLT